MFKKWSKTVGASTMMVDDNENIGVYIIIRICLPDGTPVCEEMLYSGERESGTFWLTERTWLLNNHMYITARERRFPVGKKYNLLPERMRNKQNV